MESLSMSVEDLQRVNSDLDPQASPTLAANKDSEHPKKSNIRKRTKTGCLTCRRRRIKCDEAKPTCSNCIRSKRQCEGYNTRVVFKDPLSTFPGNPFAPIAYPQESADALHAQLSSVQSKASSSQGPLPIIAPKPPTSVFANLGPFYHDQVYPHMPRANSIAALGLNMNQRHYVMNHWSPNPHVYSSQESFGIPTVSSPVQLAQQEYHQFPVPLRSPNQSFHEPLPSPSRRQSAFTRIERSVPIPNHGLPIISPPPEAPSAECQPETEEELWDTEDDASMVGSDNEEQLGDDIAPGLDANNLGTLVARTLHAPFDLNGTQLRSFHTLAEDNILVNYMPSARGSPLNNPQTAAIFWYFINITAPSINMYERNPLGPSRIFSGEPIPKSHQHIWTYVFPVLSFQHPALLQAILALGSQQMAKMSGESLTASVKHYTLGIIRSAKNYKSNMRRAQPATLAATLLSGYYEVWNSDHAKWCEHMLGARVIIQETPLREMTRSVLVMQRQKRQQQLREMAAQPPYGNPFPLFNIPNNEILDVDLGLVALLHGSPVNFDVDPESSAPDAPRPRRCTERDTDNYEHVADLYWWFSKMDVYQSILGGSHLFMEYELWTQCPPRAPIGRFDAIYGTFDHLVILLGRVANFAATDMPRKRKIWELSQIPGVSHSPPMFAGMMPDRRNIKLPRGFSPPRETPPSSETNEDSTDDLDERTTAALREWENILQAFTVFKSRLGSDFEPLSPDVQPPQHTPFGLALTYRTYSIAGIWMNFYMGLVFLQRAHPSMPPFAQLAANKVAKQTAPYANEIGRIVAGIAEDCNDASTVSTLVGAAFIESCFPLFVAAVQLKDDAQRHWTVRRLNAITRLTGWQTGTQIASGCEGAWRKAYTMGTGPQYEAEPDYDARGRHSWTLRRLDGRIQEIPNSQEKVVVKKAERAHLAFGLLSLEQDMERITLTE